MKPTTIKKRIRAVKKVAEITFALEAISAMKMKKFQNYYNRAKAFVKESMEILGILLDQESFFFFPQRKTNKIFLVVISSDRGLCGGFNNSVLRYAFGLIQKFQKRYQTDLMIVGKKGIEFFSYRNIKIKSSFTGIGDYATLEETDQIADYIYQKFWRDEYQKVFIIYNAFISSFIQKPTIIQFLPPQKETIEVILREKIREIDEKKRVAYSFEPNARRVLRVFMPFLLSTQIYHIILESNAAEHSARMIAMHNASENAQRLEGELSLKYNKMRQSQITRELIEITTAKEAM